MNLLQKINPLYDLEHYITPKTPITGVKERLKWVLSTAKSMVRGGVAGVTLGSIIGAGLNIGDDMEKCALVGSLLGAQIGSGIDVIQFQTRYVARELSATYQDIKSYIQKRNLNKVPSLYYL